MNYDEILNYIRANGKKWTIEKLDGPIIITKSNVTINITNNYISWKVDNYFKNNIETNEDNLKILLSRDWIDQTYTRGFGYIARTDNPDRDIWPEDFVQYFEQKFGFVTSIKWRARNNAYKGGGDIIAETVCSLDRDTLSALNYEIEIQISDGVGESCDLVSLNSDGYFYKEK